MRCIIHRRLSPSLFPLPLSLPFASSQAYLDGDDEDRAREVDRRAGHIGGDDRTFGGASARDGAERRARWTGRFVVTRTTTLRATTRS